MPDGNLGNTGGQQTQGSGSPGLGNSGAAAGGTPTPAPSPGAAGGAGAPSGAQGGGQGSWLDSLSPEYRDDINIKGYKSTDELAKAYIHAQKFIGADKIVVPGQTATEEDWNKIYQKLGRPEAPDKYELKADGIDNDVVNALKPFLHKMGVSQGRAPAALEAIKAINEISNRSLESRREQTIKTGLDNLRREWTDSQYDVRLKQAEGALVRDYGQEFLDWAAKCGVANDPMFIKMMHINHEKFGEDTARGGGEGGGGLHGTAIQEQINNMYADPAYLSADHPGHDGAVRQMAKLHADLARLKK